MGGPLTLAIEVSNPSAMPGGSSGDAAHPGPAAGAWDVTGPSVALARGPVVFEQEGLRSPDSRHDDDLMPAIDRMVRRAGLAPVDLERVAVSAGPGGFTGLRVAVATAKAIGETMIAQRGLTGPAARVCVAAPSACVVAEAWVRSREASVASEAFAVALASKRDTAWVTVFGGDGSVGDAMLADADGLASLQAKHRVRVLIADQFLPEAMRARAAQLGVAIQPPVFSAAACARVAHGIAAVDPAALLPLYPREPEAVTKWRALHGS